MNIFSTIAAIGWNSVTEWMEHHMLTCPSKKLFSMDCPGCGMQRSFLALLKGDLSTSLELYPALTPLIFLIIFTVVHLKFNFKNGATIIKWTQFFTCLIILAFYFYKLIIS